ncbi:hypothetical protein EON68_02040 [archaeon]|nr:MAG: hypothetical protein EON68_02040 [archaeon]
MDSRMAPRPQQRAARLRGRCRLWAVVATVAALILLTFLATTHLLLNRTSRTDVPPVSGVSSGAGHRAVPATVDAEQAPLPRLRAGADAHPPRSVPTRAAGEDMLQPHDAPRSNDQSVHADLPGAHVDDGEPAASSTPALAPLRGRRAFLFTMDSISAYVEAAARGGPAGEIVVRRSLEHALEQLGVQLDVATSDAQFEHMTRQGAVDQYDFIFLDPMTLYGAST